MYLFSFRMKKTNVDHTKKKNQGILLKKWTPFCYLPHLEWLKGNQNLPTPRLSLAVNKKLMIMRRLGAWPWKGSLPFGPGIAALEQRFGPQKGGLSLMLNAHRRLCRQVQFTDHIEWPLIESYEVVRCRI